ncbi:Energy-coupling factor transporter ATP-binding protein EcfA3 [subsurface metagenome]
MPTVFDDVSFGPINMSLSKDEVVMSVNSALKEVDMLKAIKRPSYHLSFGEKKRISIATVLSMKPQILALDEPSSNLDPKHRRDLIYFLKHIKLTRIIATHDLDLVVETCSRVLLLNKGKIAADGDSVDVLTNKSLLEEHSLEIPCLLLNKYSSAEIIA